MSSISITETSPAPNGGNYVCNFLTNYLFQDPGGGRHQLGLSYLYPGYCQYMSPPPTAYYTSYIDSDSVYQASMPGLSPITVVDPDGTVYSFPNPGSATAGAIIGGGALPTFVEDRNGNRVSVNTLANGGFEFIDTLGRGQGSTTPAISASSFGSASGDAITVSGLTGSYTVYWGTASVNIPRPNVKKVSSDAYCTGISSYVTTHPVITSIVLPNGTSYQFQYESIYGLLSKITYPTGGYVRYVWGVNPLAEFGSFADSLGTANGCQYQYDSMAVANRFVSFNGQTEVLEQDFSYTTNWSASGTGWTTKQTKLTTKDLARGLSAVTTYMYTPGGFNAPPNVQSSFGGLVPLEQTVTYQDWSGTTLRTVNKTWGPPDEMTCQSTTQGGLTSRIDYTYGSGAQITDKKEWDWGQAPACGSTAGGTPLRETVTAYHSFPATLIFTTGPSIFDRPDSVTVSGSGAQAAQTSYVYDGTAPSSAGIAVGRDTAYNGNTTVARGNATSMSKWVNTSGGSLTWDYTYDDTGQQVSMADPKGNPPAEYSYADDFTACGSPPGSTNAYLTEITDAKGFTQTFAYRYCDGQLVLAKDRNGQPTSYSYVDSLSRLTEISYPDTGQTTYTYSGACGQPATTTILLSGSSDYTESATFDGVCHGTRNTITSDPAGDDYTDTTYDGMGRVWTLSNPYRSQSDTSYGLTKTTYDALGRTTQVAYPDGSTATTSYTGNTWTVTDPAAKTRKLQSDALGRLASVAETSITPNYSTSYSYNALDDLLTVSQGGQTRTFSYDSLSRLTSATNPESGLTSYTYPTSSGSAICSGDPGSPCTRTDARSITTTYTYNDPLNRLTSKTYSDGTPTANFFYDEATVTLGSWTSPGLNYPNGRLTHTTTLNSIGTTLTATVQDYDPMGRSQNYWQCTPYNCGASSIFHGYYHYDLAGDNDWWIHPAGFTITNTISPARQVTAVQSSWVDSNHPQYLAQSISYSPWGAVSALQTGCAGSGCANAQETYQYNKRLQTAVIELGTTTQDYCLVYNYSGSNPTSCQLPSQGTTNNGNVVGYWYQDNVNSSFSHTASYTYDGVNRLSAATAKTLAGSTLWSQTYGSQGYSHPDQWGNWTCSGTGLCPSLTWNSQNNQLLTIGNYSFSYDAAGNLTQDPSNYPAQQVHTYQWDAEGRVASVDGGSTWSFTYNALGYRVQWAGSGGTDQHFFDPEGNWLGNAGEYTLVHFGERILALYEGSQTYFNHVNALGSTSMFTNQTGGPQEDMLFYPWGDMWQSWGTGGYNFAYLPYRDLSTTTDITTARFSSPNFGRWLSPDPDNIGADPSDPQTWNAYAYVRNNPTSLTDPSGSMYCDPHSAVVDKNGTTVGYSDCVSEETGASDQYSLHLAPQQETVSGAQATQADYLYAVATGVQRAGPTVNGLAVATGAVTGLAMLPAAVGGTGVTSLTLPGSLGEMIGGAYSAVTRQALLAAARIVGPTVAVITNLTDNPAELRALSTATGEGAEALAAAARSGPGVLTFTGEVPKALMVLLERAGLAFPRLTMMGAENGAMAQEWRFTAQAMEFVAKFFK